MILEQLFEIVSKSSIFDSSRAICYCSGSKINFWSHLGEGRHEKPQRFHNTPSRCRIESINSAGKRSQKVTLITCPKHFLETLISCRIYMPKNAILLVNPSGTNLKVLLFLTFCYLCRLRKGKLCLIYTGRYTFRRLHEHLPTR